MNLVSLQDIERENSNYYSEIYSTKVSRFSDEFPVSRHQNSNIIDLIWTGLDEKKLASGFISLTDIKGFAHFAFIEEIKNVKKETVSLINELNDRDMLK